MGRERRKRYHAECPAQVLVPDLPPTNAVAVDLSAGGAFLETSATLPLGLRLKLRLAPPDRRALTFAARVLRVGCAEKFVLHPELDYLVVQVSGFAVKFEPAGFDLEQSLEAYLKTLPEF